jgi:hypothetical protein
MVSAKKTNIVFLSYLSLTANEDNVVNQGLFIPYIPVWNDLRSKRVCF